MTLTASQRVALTRALAHVEERVAKLRRGPRHRNQSERLATCREDAAALRELLATGGP